MTNCTKEARNDVVKTQNGVIDLISRADAIDALRTCYDTEAITYTNGNEYIDYDQALDLINALPSAEKTGMWSEPIIGTKFCICTKCGNRNYPTRFCPECGADMRGEADE